MWDSSRAVAARTAACAVGVAAGGAAGGVAAGAAAGDGVRCRRQLWRACALWACACVSRRRCDRMTDGTPPIASMPPIASSVRHARLLYAHGMLATPVSSMPL